MNAFKVITNYKNKSCKYKLKHETVEDAFNKLIEYREKGVDVKAIYKCVFCGKYHVGHITKRTAKRERRINKFIEINKEVFESVKNA